MRRLILVAMLAGAPLGGCGAGLTDAALPSQSEAGLDIVPLTIASGGRSHRFRVEVARTADQQERGMMFRDRLAPDRGMIFPYATARDLSFWMKDTPNALDIIFIGADGRIVNIAADAVPFSTDRVDSGGPALAVLEIAGGRAAELGLQVGDRVEWQSSPSR